jgi:hypothetical protein
MALLTVFANFRIDSTERLLRMQDSFRSFRDADIEKWVINIRGPLKDETAAFLRAELGEQLVLYALDSGDGWFADSRRMLESIDSPYVLFWVEDHICIGGVSYLNQVVAEMNAAGSEYLLYSAFHNGDSVRSFARLPWRDSEAIIALDYDRAAHRRRMGYVKRNNLVCSTFVISCLGIFRRELFERILLTNDPLIKRWPKETPFDFEKNQNDVHWLPLRVAQTKRELFAFIDDDHGRESHSLISRGLYPNRVSRQHMVETREAHLNRRHSRVFKQLSYYYRELVNRIYGRVIRSLGVRS